MGLLALFVAHLEVVYARRQRMRQLNEVFASQTVGMRPVAYALPLAVAELEV